MAIQGASGPLVVFGSSGGPNEYNPQIAPNCFIQMSALMDPRALLTYQPGQSESSPVACWFIGGMIVALDYVPSTLATTNIAASFTGSSPVTLVSSSGAGITVGQSIVRSDTGATVTGLLAIDGNSMTRINYGQQATIQAWDPTKG